MQTWNTTLSTASFIRQLTLISFRWTLIDSSSKGPSSLSYVGGGEKHFGKSLKRRHDFVRPYIRWRGFLRSGNTLINTWRW